MLSISSLPRGLGRGIVIVGLLLLAMMCLIAAPRPGPVAAQGEPDSPAAPEMPAVPVGTPICGPTEDVSGAIATNTTWQAGKVYVLTGDITVNQLTTLTIQPGTVIKINYDKGFTINGKLIADGTIVNPIYFTSIRDDSICGDTNGDTTASVPNTGDWRDIHFTNVSDPASEIKRSVVRYGGKNESGYNDSWYPPITLLQTVPVFENISFEKNYRNGIGVWGSDWLTKAFKPSNVIHILIGDMRILQANTLTIPPGLTIKIEYDKGITVDGKFVAVGTEGAPIIFTSVHDDSYCGIGAVGEQICDTNNNTTGSVPNTGDWRNIHFSEFSDLESEMSHVVVRYGGKNESGYNDSWYPPIVIYQSVPTLDRISFENNFRNGVGILGSNWLSSGLKNTSVIYILYGDMRILQANHFTIPAGVKIKPEYDQGIIIDGKLSITGMSGEPVIITSTKDDTVCGIGAHEELVCDTNNDGAGSVPATGDWRWIDFTPVSDPASLFDHMIIRYGGKNESGYNDQWRAVLRINAVSPTISNTAFTANYTGIDLIDGAQPTLICNDFEGNTSPYAIWNDEPTTAVNATGNWWGSVSGPTHGTNPHGKGDEVSDGVDFTPWATTPCILPSKPAEAAFEAAPVSGEAPLAVGFFNTSIGGVTQSNWDFGDGATSTEMNPTHIYLKPGFYSPKLTITGPGGSDAVTAINLIDVKATVYRVYAPSILKPR